MNPRHAAALALVGWYLITPPLSSDGKRVVGYAPLSGWSIGQSFDSATECEHARIEQVTSARYVAEKARDPDPSNSVLVLDASLGKCVATNDPRLKGE